MKRQMYGSLSGAVRRCFLVALVVFVSFVHTPAKAQVETSEIDEIFDWATPEAPGCAIAVAHRGQQVVDRAYGSADLERGVALTTGSVFDAGSLVKQFVAAAVLLLVEEERLSLTDDVRKQFPELPDPGHVITVDHLLTHTSGLRDWVPLSRLSSDDADALALILRQRGLNFAPGEEWSYSNSGYVLLKELVARTAGVPFAEFAHKRLFEPLGMKASRYAHDPPEGRENRALAYEKEGDGWKKDVLVGNARGGGGALLSTASDLLRWNETLTGTKLGPFVTEKLQEPVRLNNGRELSYARGLFLDSNRGGRMVWHTGSAGGYKAMLSRYPEQGLSIAILCNAGESTERTTIVRRIYDLFVPATNDEVPDVVADEAGEGSETAGADAIDPSSKAGLFFNEQTGDPLRLAVSRGSLRIAGGPSLVAVSSDRFRNPIGALSFKSQDEFELRFLSPDRVEWTSMEGKKTLYRRAQPYSPTAADLSEFAGRYESDELRASFEMAPSENGLRVRLNGSPPFDFAPVARDTFQRGRMLLRFHRDAGGRALALDYSNPVLRKVTFTRLGQEAGSR